MKRATIDLYIVYSIADKHQTYFLMFYLTLLLSWSLIICFNEKFVSKRLFFKLCFSKALSHQVAFPHSGHGVLKFLASPKYGGGGDSEKLYNFILNYFNFKFYK